MLEEEWSVQFLRPLQIAPTKGQQYIRVRVKSNRVSVFNYTLCFN